MKAIVYHGNKDLRLENVKEPVTKSNEVKLQVDFCGICATDIEEYLYGPVFISSGTPHPLTGYSLPLTVGHEITGTIVECGGEVETIKTGDRVVVNGILTCDLCWWCKNQEMNQCPSMAAVGFGIDGGMAERMVWPASQVIKLPDSVPSRDAALTEPASVAYHAVRRSRLKPGERVVVLGVGTIGILAMQVAKSIGAHVYVVDRRQISLDLARDLGAVAVIDSDSNDAGQALKDLTDGVGADVVIDAAGGKETPAMAVNWVRKGGRVVLVAIYTSKPEYDFNNIVQTETELIGSLGYQKKDIEDVLRLISSGSLKTTSLISGVIRLEEVVDVGYARMLEPEKEIFRLLVSPT